MATPIDLAALQQFARDLTAEYFRSHTPDYQSPPSRSPTPTSEGYYADNETAQYIWLPTPDGKIKAPLITKQDEKRLASTTVMVVIPRMKKFSTKGGVVMAKVKPRRNCKGKIDLLDVTFDETISA